MDIRSLNYLEISQNIDQILLIEKLAHNKYKDFYDITPWSRGNFLKNLPLKDRLSAFCFNDESLIGFSITYLWDAQTAHFSRMAFNPEFKGSGLGKNILTHQLSIIKKNNIPYCTLDLIRNNIGVWRLFTDFGFSQLKGEELKSYLLEKNRLEEEYIGTNSAYIVMKKKLI